MSCGCNNIEQYGIKPINAQWTVIKGSTANLEISFLELDESTLFDTSDWSYTATVYDKYNDSLEELEVSLSVGKITVTASSDITGNWGPTTNFSTAELRFEIKAVIPQVGTDDFIWTPISGTICLMSDILSGGSL